MNRLDRYIIKKWFSSFIPALIVMITVYLAGETVFSMTELLKNGFSVSTVILHFTLKIPTIFYQMAPVASLIASLLTMTGMKKSGEITAIFVSGWGVLRLSVPFIAASVAVGIFAFYVNETLAPGANRISRDMVRAGSGPEGSVLGKERIWLIEDGRVIHIHSTQEEGTVLLEPTVLQFGGGKIGDLQLRLDALKARWDNGQWMAEKVYERRFSGGLLMDIRTRDRAALPIKTQPAEFFRVRRKPEEMNIHDLRQYVASLKKAGLPSNWHHVRIYRKSSAAALSLIFTVLALPVGLLVPLRGGAAVGVSLSILLAVVFWSVFSLFLSLGYSGLIPPPVSAWGSQVLFLSVAAASLALIRKPRLT